MSIEEFHASMLYIVVSFYNPGWYHNYITSHSDDGELHHFIFDIDEKQEGKHYLKLDHYDARMYPFESKTKKIMSYFTLFKWNDIFEDYVEVSDHFGSDWIGF
jgi:hypothetical protein